MRRLAVGLGTALLLAAVAATAAGADSKKVPDGKPIFIKYKCGACHTVLSEGIGKKAEAAPAAAKPAVKKPPDLSSTGLEHKDGWVAAFLKGKELLNGKKHIKLFRGTDAELATLSAWLETMKAEKPAKGGAEKTGK
jgi:mono/diheme cytochrome c family protein